MSDAIEIQVTRSADQKSINVTDTTDWSQIPGTIDSLTTITLFFYTSSTGSSIEEYTFDASELSEYTANGTIDLTFTNIFGTTYINDNWYIIQMNGNTGDYISNYEGFGTYYYLKGDIYNKEINGLNTPERDTTIMNPIYFKHICLKGLDELDNSNILSRDIKFKKRLSAITKMLS